MAAVPEGMTIFDLRDRLIGDYRSYVESFIEIRDEDIRERVSAEFGGGMLWPDPLLQLNPFFEAGKDIDRLVAEGTLHQECSRIFRVGKSADEPEGKVLQLHRHQTEAIEIAGEGQNYVLTTGTGSGKSLAYMVPIVDRILRNGPGNGIQAIVVYPMNALANSQFGELEKFLCAGYPDGQPPVRFDRYTGQETREKKEEVLQNPPDILLTNYVMLELILTRVGDRRLIEAAQDLRFLVLDELHTYRGRQGADVAMLVRRVRNLFSADRLQCVGTSATLAGTGTYAEQRVEVAGVASRIFGAHVRPEHVIGETLRRVTREPDLESPKFRGALAERINNPVAKPRSSDEFKEDPLAAWIESVFGIREEHSRLVRAQPRSIRGQDGGARTLADHSGINVEACALGIEEMLLEGYLHIDPATGKPIFAFRLHQFISRGDTVYATLQPAGSRTIALSGQQFAPGDRSRVLLPLAFCRECGQEYYSVRALPVASTGKRKFVQRDPSDRMSDEESDNGFLFIGEPVLPVLEDGTTADLEDVFPKVEEITVDAAGMEGPRGEACLFLPHPFRRCVTCGVEYNVRQRSDFSKLGTLGSEGRSTATTLLSLSSVRALREAAEAAGSGEALPSKLLSFTDNRQDASLQAGHFNDFVEIVTLRAALYRAVAAAGDAGLEHDTLTAAVFKALALPFGEYARNPDEMFHARTQTEKALREMLGYRLYRDLKRGWRVVMPNLEQSGLLEIQYQSLDELCAHETLWSKHHPALAGASPSVRSAIAKTLLDYLRRELVLKVSYLDAQYQESLRHQSTQKLREPWALDEGERLEFARVLIPRAMSQGDYRGHVYMSGRSGFGMYLKRSGTLPEYAGELKEEDRHAIIVQLLHNLKIAGLVDVVLEPPAGSGDVPGYQLLASALRWEAGDGTTPFHDPIRVPNRAEAGGRVNPYFVELYREAAESLGGLAAREHTAQVPYKQRQDREDDFRAGKLPILYCSPTMELGVDIADLNVVNMRNVPPTPANYAQRSGRAGRSGQPALVFTYCAAGSSHDQYFFRRPDRMVAGAVTPPRIDLANEDLVRSHVHAIWLTEVELDLGGSVKDILQLSDEARLPLIAEVEAAATNREARERARARAQAVLASMEDDLETSDWYHDGWLDDVLQRVGKEFDRAVDRWRDLYAAALRQQAAQNEIILDMSRPERERNEARRLRAEAEAQLKLLTGSDSAFQSDFYSYRYFASEGFLPGYNFPRLPLSAYIPARQSRDRDEYLSRPRFLAISEFGPGAIVYHEGSKFVINKVILPVGADDITTSRMKQCSHCGYAHPIAAGDGPDLCEQCQHPLNAVLKPIFRLENVSTRRRDKINSDEEERLRMGYEIRTGVRFTDHGDKPSQRLANVSDAQGDRLAVLRYGHAATLYRVNLGWARRKDKHVHGFVLDVERGYWESNRALEEQEAEDPMSERRMRVIPYVEDRRNALLFEPAEALEPGRMASLQAALKSAIQIQYQLEDQELAAEPLPDRTRRNRLLFFEASEGGAGVLRRLIEEPDAFSDVARHALELCHFDPNTGEDRRRAPSATEDCEAACYSCLMSYGNQPDHSMLDRHGIRDILMTLAGARVAAEPASGSRTARVDDLFAQHNGGVEAEWIRWLHANDLRLPSRSKPEVNGATPDFSYDEDYAVVYIDGEGAHPPRDSELKADLEDRGYTIIRFGDASTWEATLNRFASIFRRGA
jgi:ATP-dependent helicase YprA (DUF1998 family)